MFGAANDRPYAIRENREEGLQSKVSSTEGGINLLTGPSSRLRAEAEASPGERPSQRAARDSDHRYG
ncbi:uncharacterized [Tachysurus ichikawai]